MAEPKLQIRLAPRQRRQSRRIGLTALTDLIFILLIFFILETRFEEFKQLDFSQPTVAADKGEGQGENAAGQAEPETITLQLFASGRVWVAGETLSIAGLHSYMDARNPGADTTVVMEAQPATSAQLLVTALDELHAAGLAKILVRELAPADD